MDREATPRFQDRAVKRLSGKMSSVSRADRSFPFLKMKRIPVDNTVETK